MLGQDHHKHEHEHEHKPAHEHEAGHKHHHDDKEEQDIPAWKKKALEAGKSDPMVAPFGGNWTTESSLAASDEPMEE